MHHAAALVSLFLLLAAAPQEKVPEVDDWKQYLPLHEGGEWEYAGKKNGGVVKAMIRVTREKRVNDLDCKVVEWDSISPTMTRKNPAVVTHTLYVSAGKTGLRIQRRETARDAKTPETGDAPKVYGAPEFLVAYPIAPPTEWIKFFSMPGPFKVGPTKEKIKTPAGTFDCVVLTSDYTFNRRRASRRWYLCKGVGLVKDMTFVEPLQGSELALEEELILVFRRPPGKEPKK